MTERITEQWLADIVNTVQQRDHDAHTNLISKNETYQYLPELSGVL